MCITYAVFFVHISQLSAEEFKAGVVVVGAESGLSLKYNMNTNRAIQGTVAWSSHRDYGTLIQADYLFDNMRQFKLDGAGPFNLYYGLGLRVADNDSGPHRDKTSVALRLPFGLTYNINNPNIELFGELGPSLEVSPRSDVVIDVESVYFIVSSDCGSDSALASIR